MKSINLRLRTEIIYVSLNLENIINLLLTKYLLITDRKKTKNFGNRAGISFQSKIDLLYDIEVLNKEEHQKIELVMIFRNKFLHDIKYSSFSILLEDLDNGIKNKLYNFLENKDSKTENDLEIAFQNLNKNISKFLADKIKEIDEYGKIKIEFLTFQNKFLTLSVTEGLDLLGDLKQKLKFIENEDLKSEFLERILLYEKNMDFKENVKKFTEYSNSNMIKILLK